MPVEVRGPKKEEFSTMGDLWEEFMSEQNEKYVHRILVTPENRARFLQFVNEKASTGNILVAVAPGDAGGEDVLAGYVTFDRVPFAMDLAFEEAAVLDIYVKSEHRGKGIGRALLEGAKKLVKKEGITHLRLQVYSNNDDAIDFYRHLGFRRYLDIMNVAVDEEPDGDEKD